MSSGRIKKRRSAPFHPGRLLIAKAPWSYLRAETATTHSSATHSRPIAKQPDEKLKPLFHSASSKSSSSSEMTTAAAVPLRSDLRMYFL